MKSVMKVSLCLLVVSEVVALTAVSKQPGHLSDTRIDKEEKPKEDERPAVVRVEDHLRKHASKHKERVMKAIDSFRAEVCAHMHDDFGIDFKTFPACHKFMKRTCNPGDDHMMDGDEGEVPSGKGYCKQYFPVSEAKAEKKVTEEEAEEATAAERPEPDPEPVESPAPAKQKKVAPAPAPEAAGGKGEKGDNGGAAPAPAAKGGSAPAPGPAGGPSPAPGPVPVPDNHAYYYKDGGKHASRLHMNEKLGLPAQGYWGKLVEHEDQETMTDDWQREFGPKSKHSNVAEICKEHPDSAWCKRRFGHFRSSGKAATALFPFAMLLVGYAF